MKSSNRILAIIVLSLATLWIGTAQAKSEAVDRPGFTAADNEYYLTEQLYFFFRPGVEFELLDFEIPEDRLPLVTFSVKDPGGMPLDMDGVTTPGAIEFRMMLTYIPQGEEHKISYHPRDRDRSGVYASLGDGVYTYKFSDALPADYDADATHTLGVVTRRDLSGEPWNLERYYDNDVIDFVPSGAEMVTPPRDLIKTTTCNRCHDPLAMHGSNYREVGMCQQCHTKDRVDREGLNISLNVMIHRVHAEAAEYPAPLNDCEVCHVGGTPTDDFPLVANPAPAPACDSTGLSTTKLTWGDKGGVELRLGAANGHKLTSRMGSGSFTTGKWMNDLTEFFLVEAATGDVLQKLQPNLTVFGCANNPPGAIPVSKQTGKLLEPGELHTRWLNRTSRAVCKGCHADVDFENGSTGHPVQDTDEACHFCHAPTGPEFRANIKGAHTVPYTSARLGGVLVDIISISNTGPGQRPVVTFALRNKWGPLEPSALGRLRFSLSGPNDDFAFYAQDDALSSLEPSGQNWRFQFKTPLPANAMGSFSLGVEGRINNAVIDPNPDAPVTLNDQMQNFIEAFAVTGDLISPRREVVNDAKCESCHSNLSLHGSNRHDAGGYCQTCHMPSATDEPEREPGDTPQSVDFRYMVHKIHRGAELENGYVVLGHNGSVNDFSHVEYPGDLRNCEACHESDTYTLPLSLNLEMVTTPRDFFTPMGPETAACLSCHDSQYAAVHASSNANQLGEACAACHGTGKTYAVEKVHAR